MASRIPEFGKRSAAAMQNTTSTDLDVDQLVSSVCNNAYEHIRKHFVLVPHDYRLVSACEMTSRFISRFVQAVHENGHLFLSSRTLLDLLDLMMGVLLEGWLGSCGTILLSRCDPRR